MTKGRQIITGHHPRPAFYTQTACPYMTDSDSAATVLPFLLALMFISSCDKFVGELNSRKLTPQKINKWRK